VAAIVATGVKSFSRDDFFSLPGDQQQAILQEEQLEAQARPEDYGADALSVLEGALKIIGIAGSIGSAVSLAESVPGLVKGA
jgi:hypothetical protein